MPHNVLVTGAAGYIGGSVIADILSRTDETLKAVNIFAAARSQDQVDKISKLDRVHAFLVDLQDKPAVEYAIAKYESKLSSTSSSIQLEPFSQTCCQTYSSSVASMFTEEGGWPFGKVKDSDPLIDRQRELGLDNPVRKTNIVLADEGKAQGVETFNIPIQLTYGRGSGECRKLSVNIPALIRTSIKLKTVHKFDQDSTPGNVHISDLTDLYVLILNKILKEEPIAVGTDRYFFSVAHRISWWKIMDKIAEGLYARGLVDEPTPKIWPNYDVAADALGFPRKFIRPIGDLEPANGTALGWRPKQDSEQKCLDQIDQEINDVEELDTVRMGLFDTLIAEQK
ncbi:hypothetical protein FOXG_09541 [Fusarium oxysporum f. sp. lycopersici 4287]|uniref:3-beta hydroxysteroid dehydrogenase/isomerase domain-containing protein n=2 Tax=Fusarium oxysporum TaxID=5507 RepID=A0A0J9WPD3_FUSO4|nr:hypothetical protein FOXG_09541 [Fusarium oxysporum f. sp. lycopersici 4287]KNB08832.1 hypothetical protein FOXG_09541 [Fusarium oxysporum f. sp. lycopersici 4287]